MSQRVKSFLKKKYRFKNYIRMTLKVVETPLHLFFNVALNVDNEFCVENMHILANMRLKICIKGWLIIGSKFVSIWVVKREGGGSRQMVTNGDKGGGGSKIGIFTVTYFLNGA